MIINKRIFNAKSIPELFDIVKTLVKKTLGFEQAGLMVGVSDLGASPSGYIGAFYNLNANMIIINKIPLALIKKSEPKNYNYYLFHILMHEYLHAVGHMDEKETRDLTNKIITRYLGKNHISTSLEKFKIKLDYYPIQDVRVEFIERIDSKNMNYIA